MAFKVIRIRTLNGGKTPGALTIKCNSEDCNYHVFFLKRAMLDDFCYSPYVCVFDESMYKDHVIAKICYSSSKAATGVWKVIGSTLPSLDMPSLDQSIIDLVSSIDTEEFSFQGSACGLCDSINKEYTEHLYNGVSEKDFNKKANDQKDWHKRSLMVRTPCSFFTSILPYKSAQKDIKYFWKNNKLFVLRRYNNKIYEGYQWLNLSEEEKEAMLNG